VQAAREYTVRLTTCCQHRAASCGWNNTKKPDKGSSARDGFRKIDGITKVRTGGLSAANGQSVATLTISYQGEMLDLVYDLQEKAADLLDMKIDATDAATGTLTLNATKVETIVVNRATALIQPDQPDHATRRASFLEEYQSEGSPKIGIMVNRELAGDDS
jgi:hypothetical protein